MHDANWWLIGLAFVLGLLLTFALMIRRVKGEVPVSSSASPDPSTAKTSADEEAATTKMPRTDESESELQTDEDVGKD
jgi:uncharacterized membrane protein ArfC